MGAQLQLIGTLTPRMPYELGILFCELMELAYSNQLRATSDTILAALLAVKAASACDGRGLGSI